jgi:hypothetical protein
VACLSAILCEGVGLGEQCVVGPHGETRLLLDNIDARQRSLGLDTM